MGFLSPLSPPMAVTLKENGPLHLRYEMRRLLAPLAAGVAVLWLTTAIATAQDSPLPRPSDSPVADFEREVKPFIATYCLKCHVGDKAKGGLAFDKIETESDVRKYRQLAERVRAVLDAGTMPPEDPQPADGERTAILNWLEQRVLKVDCSTGIDPGRVTIRRLNKAEYNNTIRDLLLVDFKPAEDFPSDDVGYGFDNIGDVLTLPPLLLEKYLAAAERISETAILAPDAEPKPIVTEKGRTLASVSQTSLEFQAPAAGEYRMRARAWAMQAGDELAKMEILVDQKIVDTITVDATGGQGANYDVTVTVEPGKHTFAVKFINDYYKPDDPNPNNRDRNLVVEQLQAFGPLNVLPENLPVSHRTLVTCRPETPDQLAGCCQKILKPFVTRAWRRPVSDEELARLIPLVEQSVTAGDSFERGLQLAVQVVLVSPEFLFRLEPDSQSAESPAVRTINDWELASRLSYFLWSSLPDQELFDLAAMGTLRQGENLSQQVRRMLKDPKSSALVENFAGQWLNLRLLKTINPDKQRFPGFDDKLRSDMEQETRLFFESVVREDRSIFDLLDSSDTYLNERLARHYQVPEISGEEFRRVTLPNRQRGGLLGHASILTVTSNPTRTSPVKRGKWVLENIFNAPPPPPPPNVPELKDSKDQQLTGSLRQRMEQHRSNPSCAVCHVQMDTLGFGLENYDAIGGWRDKEGDFAIDASGTLPGGEAFQGPAELRQILKSRRAEFRKCLTEKLLTYALGRGLEYYDECAVNQMVQVIEANRDTFSAVVLEIVSSDPFQKRRAKRGDEP